VEIVRYDDNHIYVRAKFEFYNGHQCDVSGIAGYEGGAFVFHDPAPSADGTAQCTLSVRQTDKDIEFTDRLTPDGVATCRSYCGARGSLSATTIARASKRPIRYMDRLKASREYARAIEDLKKYESTASVRP
jgi:hypothetical protein